MRHHPLTPTALACLALALFTTRPQAADWPMFGRDATRNAVSPEKSAPTDWQLEQTDRAGRVTTPSRNIAWSAPLGTVTSGSPVISGGLVWVCTNNQSPRDPKTPGDAGVLMCFRERDGAFLWQQVTPRLPDRQQDGPIGSIGSPPLIEGDALWYVTNRWEVVCLDIAPLLKGAGQPRERWRLDMPKDLGVFALGPTDVHNLRCAIGASFKGMIYVITGNGVDGHGRTRVAAPAAPSLICLDKATGRVIWADASPGTNILSVQWASPLVAEIAGRPQVIAPQGDGWLRSFDAATGAPLWQFDALPRDPLLPASRDLLVSAPVLHEGRVHVTTGQEAEHGEGPGALWCIEPTKIGDVSLTVEDLAAAPFVVGGVPPRRPRKPNPNSAAAWKFDRVPAAALANGRLAPKDRMNRALAGVTASDGLIIAADFSGHVHALDARTGRQLWTHDVDSAISQSPLICDGRIYVTGEDGRVSILAASKEKAILLAEHDMGKPIYAAPVLANGTLYVTTTDRLYAIRPPAR